MRKCLSLALFALAALNCRAQSQRTAARLESEYYVAAYARHYNVPVRFVRAIVEQESGWRPCPVSPKGAAGLIQLMPLTAFGWESTIAAISARTYLVESVTWRGLYASSRAT